MLDRRLPFTVGWGLVVCDLAELPDAALATVDALARLQLSARRSGCELRARGARAEFVGLWHWVGLGGVGPLGDESR